MIYRSTDRHRGDLVHCSQSKLSGYDAAADDTDAVGDDALAGVTKQKTKTKAANLAAVSSQERPPVHDL